MKFIILFISASLGLQAAPMSIVERPVPHPAHLHHQASPYQWRTQSGSWGEHIAEQSLRRRGFHIQNIKSGPHGIDRIAYRPHPLSGKIIDAKFVEVKVGRGSLKLNETKSGIQGSRRYVLQRVWDMRSSPDPHVRDFGKQLRHYIVKSGKPFTSMSEVHHINTATGRYRVLRPDTIAVTRNVSLRAELARIVKTGTNQRIRAIAQESLLRYDSIRRSTMQGPASPVKPRPVSTLSRGLKFIRGPLAVAAVTVEAIQLRNELGNLDRLLSLGQLSIRQHTAMRRTAIYRGVGGMVGSGAGAAFGTWAGGTLATGIYFLPGGQVLIPFAPWINSAGALLGGVTGGWVGGILGSASGEALAGTTELDESEHRRRVALEDWFLATPPPPLEINIPAKANSD